MLNIKTLPIDIISLITINLEVPDVIHLKMALNYRNSVELPCRYTIYKSTDLRIDNKYKKYMIALGNIRYIQPSGEEIINITINHINDDRIPMTIDDMKDFYGININKSIPNLPQLPNVKCLFITNEVFDISEWSHLKSLKFNLKEFKLDNKLVKLTKLTYLETSNCLDQLDLRYNTKLLGLQTRGSIFNDENYIVLCKLRYLNIVSNDFITYIPKLPNLEILNCTSASKLERIDDQPSLKVLICCCLKDININNLTTIEYLDCSYAKFVDISNLRNLKYLNCEETSIKTINSLNLKVLSCYNCLSIELNNLNNIIYLNCGSTNINYVNHMTELEYLFCRDTKIIDVFRLKKLKILCCNYTKIKDISQLTNLKFISHFGNKDLEKLAENDRNYFMTTLKKYKNEYIYDIIDKLLYEIEHLS
jgi:hypothetical protein